MAKYSRERTEGRRERKKEERRKIGRGKVSVQEISMT